MPEKKLPPELAAILNSYQDSGSPTAAEGLMLLKAFLSIRDKSLRTLVVSLVQKLGDADKAAQRQS